MSAQTPPVLDHGTEQLTRQLSALRLRSRHVAQEVRRIRADLVELLKRIDSHFSSKDGLP